MSKLPDEIRLVISRSMSILTAATFNDEWKIDELLKFVKQELESRELCNFVANSADETKQKRNIQTDHYTASSLFCGTSEKGTLTCTYCGKDHSSARCYTVTDVSARKSILRRKRRCFLCLRPNHIIKFCQMNCKCGKCKGKHHISICESYPEKSMDSECDSNRITSNVVSHAKSSTFLQMAKGIATGIDVQPSKQIRVLFDGCSQKSFVTVNVSKCLNLQSIRKERMIIKAFGSKEETMNLLDVVNVRIWDIFKKTGRQIEAYVVPFICSPISGQNIQLAKSKCEHLFNLKLAESNDDNS